MASCIHSPVSRCFIIAEASLEIFLLCLMSECVILCAISVRTELKGGGMQLMMELQSSGYKVDCNVEPDTLP